MIVDITFGILNYNPNNDPEAEAALQRCMSSFFRHRSLHLSSEVYVIDQGSVDQKQRNFIEQYTKNYGWRSIFLDRNVGISRGINMLARIARGEYVCLITSDTEFSPGLDLKLMNALKENPHVWQICPASDNASSDYQRAGFQDGGLAYCLAAQELTIQMWPRWVFDKIGYFEERFRACFENLDFSLRAFLAGGCVATTHDAFCRHDLNTTTKNGAINHAYDGYIDMKGQFNKNLLYPIWYAKWPNLSWSALYQPPPNEEVRQLLLERFSHNIYLPYIQDVGY